MTLKEWRQAKGWSQAQVAQALGALVGGEVSQQSVFGWENGVVPNAVVGEAVRRMTAGRVTGDSFGKGANA